MAHLANDTFALNRTFRIKSGPADSATVALTYQFQRPRSRMAFPQERLFCVLATSRLKANGGSCRMQNAFVFFEVPGKARQGMETKSAISTLPDMCSRKERKKPDKRAFLSLFLSPCTAECCPALYSFYPTKRGFHTTPHLHVGLVRAI